MQDCCCIILRMKFLELFLVHPGGPFWKNKDIGSWSIPKGEIEENEDHLKAAIRETEEETGISINYPLEKFERLTESKTESPQSHLRMGG